MKQPTDEKGKPTNDPAGTGGAGITPSFADGNVSDAAAPDRLFGKVLYDFIQTKIEESN